jgi:hypothetical protein
LTPSKTFCTLLSVPHLDQHDVFQRKKRVDLVLSILLVFGIYFAAVGLAMAGYIQYSRTFSLFFQLLIAFVALEVSLHLLVANRAPLDARLPADEREELISLRADRAAGYTLAVGAFCAIGTLHLGADQREMAHAVLLAFAVSQLTKYATVIALHRRDAA